MNGEVEEQGWNNEGATNANVEYQNKEEQVEMSKHKNRSGATTNNKGKNNKVEYANHGDDVDRKEMEKESIIQEQDEKVRKDVEKDNTMQVPCTSASFTEKIDFSPIIYKMDEVEKRLNNDLSVSTEDILLSMKKFGEADVDTIKKYVESAIESLDRQAKQCIDNTTHHIVDKTQKASQNMIDRVNTAARTLKEEQEKISSKMISVDQRVNDVGESIESIEGNLQRLDQLDDIVKLLQNKGLIMNMEIPPVNAEEEDIINLVRYSQKITEQLGYAARDLIRKQVAFKSQAQSNANEQSMMEQKIAVAHEEGVKEGKKIFIKQLISKYADVDAIKESKDSHVHAIWVLLEELGVAIDGDGIFSKCQEVVIRDEEADRMTGIYNGITDGGRYKVLRTGLVYDGEIIYKAEFEKVEEEKEKVEEEEKQESKF